MRAMTGEETSSGDLQADSKESGGDDDEADVDVSSSSEESRQKGHSPTHKKPGVPRSNNDEGEVSSVTTR